MSSADGSLDFDAQQTRTIGTAPLSIALIGPDEARRSVVAKALAETRRAKVREFNSYPPELKYLQPMKAQFDVLILDLDSEPDFVLDLVERASVNDAVTIMVYSESRETKLAVRAMRAGVREYLLLPLEQGAVAEALTRIELLLQEKPAPREAATGSLLVFVGSKGGAGVTTVACNIAIAMAQTAEQRILLIDLALPIGDAALCLGIAANYSTDDALKNIERLDATFLQDLLEKHRSGVFVLAAPTNVPEVEVSKESIAKLIAVARRGFDHVIVDAGSRIDVAAKTLFKDASTVYLVTQTGISDLRNSNRLIAQFFAAGKPNLEIVINRFESRLLESVNEDVIAKAIGKPVRWTIPNDSAAARELQYGETGVADTAISRICLKMASSINGSPAPQEIKKRAGLRSLGRSIAKAIPGDDEPLSITITPPVIVPTTPAITWPEPEPIAYGAALGGAQLNASTSIPGRFDYSPAPGKVLPAGVHELTVTFTPEDSANYAAARAAVPLTVAKATPALHWPAPGKIAYGAALGGAQLNASTSIPGRFDYSPAPGKVLPAGVHELTVTFTPEDSANYAAARAAVPLTVAKATPALHWPAPDPVPYGTLLSTAQLCAAAPIPGTFEYSPGLGALLATGEHKLTAVFIPEDTSNYSPSQTATSLIVAKATPAITWQAPEPIAYGSKLTSAQLNAKASVPGCFVYAPAAGEAPGPDVHEIAVTFTPADALNYTTARAVVPLARVAEKLLPHITWPEPSAISYGTALSAAQLNATASVPGIFVYTPSAGHVLAPGRYTLSASFTPSDAEKYATAEASVVLIVEGLPDVALPPTVEAPSTQLPTAINFAGTDSAPEAVTSEHAAAKTTTRQTRTYKGAVYEKGEDNQWHLQKK